MSFRKILAVMLTAAFVVVMGMAEPAQAGRPPQEYEWPGPASPEIRWNNAIGLAVDYDWSDFTNWKDAVDATGIPGIAGGAANTTAHFEQWKIDHDVNVKVNEPVDTGTGDIYIRLRSSGGADMYINGTGSLKCSTYWVRQSSDYVICQVPLEVTTMVKLEWRWGYGRFENTVETPIVRVGDGDFTFAAHAGNDKIDAIQMWYDRDSSIPEMYQYNAIDSYEGSTPLSILIDDGGIYGGYVDGAFGTLPGNSVSAIQGSSVIVGAPQTSISKLLAHLSAT